MKKAIITLKVNRFGWIHVDKVLRKLDRFLLQESIEDEDALNKVSSIMEFETDTEDAAVASELFAAADELLGKNDSDILGFISDMNACETAASTTEKITQVGVNHCKFFKFKLDFTDRADYMWGRNRGSTSK